MLFRWKVIEHEIVPSLIFSNRLSKFEIVCVFEKIVRVIFLSDCFNVIKEKRDRVRFVSKSVQRN